MPKFHMHARPAAIAFLMLAPTVGAQGYEAFPEGFSSFFLPAGDVTLTDLDQGLGTMLDPFFIDDASTGLLRYDVGSPALNHVVTFGNFVPGGDNLYGRCKSFRILFAQVTPAAYFTMWLSRADAGNGVKFELKSGGQHITDWTVPIPHGTAPFFIRMNPTVAGGFDEIVVTGSGPHNGGAFHGVLDGWILGAAVDFAPTCDGGMSPIHTPCPCGNDSTEYDSEGCMHSLGYGGRLRLSGFPSISNDTLQLVCMQLPEGAPAMFFQGTQSLTFSGGAVFGDGLRCAGGTVVRLGIKTSVGGFAFYPEPGDAPISVRGQVTQGAGYAYQVWFRNAAAFCTPAGFNLSNGFALGWSG